MAKFTKYNNPNKRRKAHKMSRTDADIMAAKNMLDDRLRGIDRPLSCYDMQSDQMCGEKSRQIFERRREL